MFFAYHHVNFQYFLILSLDLWSVSPGGSLEVSHIKIWWFSFFDFTRVGFENIWESKIYNPFPWIVILNLGTWKFNTVFSMGIQKNKTWVKCLAQNFWKSAYPNVCSIVNMWILWKYFFWYMLKMVNLIFWFCIPASDFNSVLL